VTPYLSVVLYRVRHSLAGMTLRQPCVRSFRRSQKQASLLLRGSRSSDGCIWKNKKKRERKRKGRGKETEKTCGAGVLRNIFLILYDSFAALSSRPDALQNYLPPAAASGSCSARAYGSKRLLWCPAVLPRTRLLQAEQAKRRMKKPCQPAAQGSSSTTRYIRTTRRGRGGLVEFRWCAYVCFSSKKSQLVICVC
jgi:hypothetical protein